MSVTPLPDKPRVLVVDNDRVTLEIVLEILRSDGMDTKGATGGAEALEIFGGGAWDIVITGVVMDGLTGIGLLRRVKAGNRLLPVICMSGYRSFDDAVEMIRGGAFDFLYKPINRDRLLNVVESAFSDYRRSIENEHIIVRSQSWARELLTLRQLGESSSRDMLQVLFRKTVEAVAETLQIETASLMIIEGDHLTIAAAMGLPKEIVGKAQMPLGSGISGYVAQTGEPVLINDISKDDRFKPSKFRKQYSTQSALCVPLMHGDNVLGVINANNKTNGEAFTRSDLDLLVTIAAQVAMAVDNTRLFKGLEEKAQALEKAHRELVRLDKDKTELILNISHELKTPLTSIMGFANLLYGLDVQGKSEDLADYAGRIETSAGLLNHLIDRMLELFRLEAGRSGMNRGFIPLQSAVSQAVAALEGTLHERDVREDHSGFRGARVYTDRTLFTRALGLILENSVKFSPEDTPIAISGCWHDDLPTVPVYAAYADLGKTKDIADGWVEIMVSDLGEGMSAEEIPVIFEKFRQLGDIMTTKPTGIGLGLPIARTILELQDGALWAESSKGEGSTFHILLPGKKA